MYQSGFDPRSIEGNAMGDQKIVRCEEFIFYKRRENPEMLMKLYTNHVIVIRAMVYSTAID
jgi:hypothetical protein